MTSSLAAERGNALQPSFFVYVAYHGGRAIDHFAGDADGALRHVARHALSGMGLPLALNSDGMRLYASTFDTPGRGEVDSIDSFSRDPATGTLEHLHTAPTVGRLTHISVDKTDRYVLGASYFANVIVSHRIQPDGSAGAAACTFPTGKNAHQILTDASNRFAFVPNLGDDQVMQIEFDAKTGSFAENHPPLIEQPRGAGCRHFAHHPNGQIMVLVNERDGSVVSFRFNDTDGTLQELHRTSVLREALPRAWAAQIHVSPDGAHVFVSERNTHILTRWRIDPETGVFSDKVTIDVARNPRCFDIDPSGRFLVLGGLDDNVIEVFDISDPDIAPQRRHVFASHSEPSWVEIVPVAS